MNFDEAAGAVVQRIRTEAGLSQADLAEKVAGAGVSMHQQTVAKIERGTRPLRLEEALAIAEATGNEIWVFETDNQPRDIAAQRVVADADDARRKAEAAIDHYGRSLLKAVTVLQSMDEADRGKLANYWLEEHQRVDDFARSIAHAVAEVERKHGLPSTAEPPPEHGLAARLGYATARVPEILDMREKADRDG